MKDRINKMKDRINKMKDRINKMKDRINKMKDRIHDIWEMIIERKDIYNLDEYIIYNGWMFWWKKIILLDTYWWSIFW